MGIKESWRNKSYNVIGGGIVVLIYLILIAVVLLTIPNKSVGVFLMEYSFLLILAFCILLILIITLLIYYFEGRKKRQIYTFLKANIEAFVFAGSSYYLSVYQSDQPIVFAIISLALLGTIKFVDAILSLYDYLFNGGKENEIKPTNIEETNTNA